MSWKNATFSVISKANSTNIVSQILTGAISTFQSEAKKAPKMSTFLSSLGSYNTALQMKKKSDGVRSITTGHRFIQCYSNPDNKLIL